DGELLVFVVCFCFFFFSSRRRHTRLQGDWSSDVCSSDLIHGHGTGALRKGIGAFLDGHPLVEKHSFESEEHGGKAITIVELQKRSEERRVGKECRYRRGRDK